MRKSNRTSDATNLADVTDAVNAANAPNHNTAKQNTAKRDAGLFDAILPHWSLSDALKAAIIGIGFGSFAFLAVAAIDPDWIPVTRMSVLSLFVLSAAISELSYIFLFDEALPAAAMYAIHCVLTFALVIVWMLVNGWQHVLIRQFPLFFAIFVGIYVMVWLINIVYAKLAARSMNRRLHRRG